MRSLCAATRTRPPVKGGLTVERYEQILTHPRLVGPWSPALEALVRQYLAEGRPFTVILDPDPIA